MHPLFERLEAALARQPEPVGLYPLQPPATQAALVQLEQQVGVRLPDDVRNLYLAHNGERDIWYRTPGKAPSPPTLPCLHTWLPLEQALQTWNMHREVEETPDYFGFPDTEPTDQVKAQNYSPKWIPIGADNTGCCIHVDLDPGPAGRMGQLIYYDRDTGIDRDEVVASSLTAYLQQLIHCLEQNLLVVTQDQWWARATGKPVYRLWQLTGPDWQPPEALA